jgi:hypothetical protein
LFSVSKVVFDGPKAGLFHLDINLVLIAIMGNCGGARQSMRSLRPLRGVWLHGFVFASVIPPSPKGWPAN